MEAPPGKAARSPLKGNPRSTTLGKKSLVHWIVEIYALLKVYNHGPVYNVEKAGNVFSGINYGKLTLRNWADVLT